MSRRGENIYKRGDGRWEGRIKSGKKYKSFYGSTYREVKKKMYEAKIVNSENSKIKQPSADMETLTLEWLQLQRNRTKESTFIKYTNFIYNHIIPVLGKVEVKNINTKLIETFSNEKLSSGRLDRKGGLSAKTVRDMLTVIQSILSYGMETGRGKEVRILYPREGKKEMNILTSQQQQILENYLLQHNTPDYIGILLVLYTGLRIGEVCALQWQDFYLENGYIQIRKTMQRVQDLTNKEAIKKTKIIITTPKSYNSVRTIPIPSFLIPLLKQQECKNKKAYFLTGVIHQFMEPRALQYRFGRILDQCNIPHITFHALRHTFASRGIEKGFDVKSLSEILGHASVNITLNRYVHSSMEQKIRNMELFCPVLSEDSKPSNILSK